MTSPNPLLDRIRPLAEAYTITQQTLDSILSHCTSQQDNVECMYIAGRIYEKRLDATKAKEYYKRAAEKEHLPAKIHSLLLEYNLSVEINTSQTEQHQLSSKISALARNIAEQESIYKTILTMAFTTTAHNNKIQLYALLFSMSPAALPYVQHNKPFDSDYFNLLFTLNFEENYYRRLGHQQKADEITMQRKSLKNEPT